MSSSEGNEAVPDPAVTSRQLAHRLVALATAGRDATHGEVPDGDALAVHEAAERACRALSRSLGAAGFGALLTRALALTEPDHPLLAEVRLGRNAQQILGDVAGIIRVRGAPALAAALEDLLETLFGLLGRLIGNDMVARLVEPSAPAETTNDEDEK